MRLNQFIFLLVSTVVLGAFMGILLSSAGLSVHIFWFTGLITGAFFATTSLMGFWAYLTLNFIARITLPRRVWRWAQALLLLIVLYDMLWWRYHLDATNHPAAHASFWTFFVQGMWPLVVAVIGAIAKQRISGRGNFLPALFYLYVFTVVDWLLVIRSESGPIVDYSGIVMMACNVYLALIFGKLLSPVPRHPIGVKNAVQVKAASTTGPREQV
jgi:KinB signaling pathway activation protein